MPRLSASDILRMALIGLALGALPHALGFLLGFAAFAVTPVLSPCAAVAAGLMIPGQAPSSPWTGVIVASLVAATTYVGLHYATLAYLAYVNGAWEQMLPLPMGVRYFVVGLAGSAPFLALGAWLGSARRK